MNSSSAAITVEAVQLSKRYGTRVAVDHLSFAAHQGEVMGLLGPNGAGKTSAIRLLTTILAPTSGQFRITGIDGSRAAEIRRVVGVLPEINGFPEHQSGQDYLRYHGRLFGLSPAEASKTAGRLLAELGLADRAASRIATYSRGMRQRLGIARALINDPAVVFLDEPTLGLDPAGQHQVLEIIRGIAQQRGVTVILSTHTLPEVEEVCSSVLILDRGRVLAKGTVAEIIRMAAADPTAQLQVPADQAGRARDLLARIAGASIESTVERPGVLRITIPHGGGTNAALQVILGADIPVLAFDVEGTRLSDAFLTMTSQDVP
jgi:ABC-2 type transport system ATP-binding protein